MTGQIGDYGQNCTGAWLTPNPPTPLLSDNSSITNITFDLPNTPAVDDGTSNVANTANITNFVNGTASGLTCFIHPDTNFVGWPYGGGGVNAAPSVIPSSTIGGGGGSQSSLAAPSPSESDNGAVGAQLHGPLMSLMAVVLSGVLGAALLV